MIPSLNLLSVERIISEVGLDMSRWPSEKHFCAWLGVPLHSISGGKDLKKKPGKNANGAAAAFRIGDQSAMQSKSAAGAFIRRVGTESLDLYKNAPSNLVSSFNQSLLLWFLRALPGAKRERPGRGRFPGI